jgi:hypothetical protein
MKQSNDFDIFSCATRRITLSILKLMMIQIMATEKVQLRIKKKGRYFLIRVIIVVNKLEDQANTRMICTVFHAVEL